MQVRELIGYPGFIISSVAVMYCLYWKIRAYFQYHSTRDWSDWQNWVVAGLCCAVALGFLHGFGQLVRSADNPPSTDL